MTERFAIRKADYSDAEFMGRLSELSFDPETGEGWSTKEMASILKNESGLGLLAAEDGAAQKIVGFLLARHLLGEAELFLVGVLPRHRRQGVAQGLMKNLMARLRAIGVDKIHLEVRADNAAALALYHAHKFSCTGRRAGYYKSADGRRQDAITLQRSLLET